MKYLWRWISVLSCLVFFLVNTSFVSAQGQSLVMLDEFVPYPGSGGQEWIELLNPSQTDALDLTGWRLVVHQGPENNYTYYYSQNLSGTVPRSGFLTFTTDDGVNLPDDGACLVLFQTNTISRYAVKYGNGICDDGAEEQNATGVTIEQGKSIYYNLDNRTWNSGSTPTRGWCNPGSGECPTVATIVSTMGNEGVATNLGNQSDFSRISGLYFRKSSGGQNVGQITFLAEMNFTDRDALSWMQSLDGKLSISQGVIGLDADLIKNLTNTQASLTMYNISLANPTILVDGSPDNGNVVSGLTYDRAAGTLTFTAAHFTTFQAAETSATTTSSSSNTSAPGCGDWPPAGAPNLFELKTGQTEATLYFVPAKEPVSYYYVTYGHKEGTPQFGTQFSSNQKIGVITHTIRDLAPNTTYYFSVRAGNGCMPGPWSAWKSGKTQGSVAVKAIKEEAVLGAEDFNTKEASPSPVLEKVLTVSPDDVIGEPTVGPINPDPNGNLVPPAMEPPKLSFWQKLKNFFGEIFGK